MFCNPLQISVIRRYVSLTKHAALACCMMETTTPHTYIHRETSYTGDIFTDLYKLNFMLTTASSHTFTVLHTYIHRIIHMYGEIP